MPILMNLRNNNRIITLSAPGKTPVLVHPGSHVFYNSLELLCIAAGSCFAGELLNYCKENKIDPLIFESIVVDMNNFVINICVQHPKDLTDLIKDNIRYLTKTCRISQLLRDEITCSFKINDTPVEELVDKAAKATCCGGSK